MNLTLEELVRQRIPLLRRELGAVNAELLSVNRIELSTWMQEGTRRDWK